MHAKSLLPHSTRLSLPRPSTRSILLTTPRPRSLSSIKMGAPVILCGKTEQIGRGVIANLKPEFDGLLHLSKYLPLHLSS